jgi:ATP synthase protein I
MSGREPASGAPSGGDMASAGLQFAAAIVAFMFAGIWLDRKLGTSPWFVILFVFLGAGGGFYSIYRRLTGAQRRTNAEKARDLPKSGGGSATR